MDLYIEYVIIDNMVMNYVILKMIDVTMGATIKKFNKVTVCSMGTVFAIFLPYLYFNKLLLFGYRFVVSIILVLCIQRFKKLRLFLGVYFLFVLYTFLLGGVCFGLINIMGFEYSASNLIMSTFEFPMGIFVLILFMLLLMFKRIILYAKNRFRVSNYMYNVTIFDGCNSASIVGFMDSGNNIELDNNGINIISVSTFLKLHKDIDLMDVIQKKKNIKGLQCVDYINIGGIGEEEKYLTFKIDKMEVNGRIFVAPRMVLAMKNFGNYDCILHRQFVEGINEKVYFKN